jgi:hypothetical protein
MSIFSAAFMRLVALFGGSEHIYPGGLYTYMHWVSATISAYRWIIYICGKEF